MWVVFASWGSNGFDSVWRKDLEIAVRLVISKARGRGNT